MSKCFKGKITVLRIITEKELRLVISIPGLGRDDPEVGRMPRKLWLDLKGDAKVVRDASDDWKALTTIYICVLIGYSWLINEMLDWL